MKYLDLNEKGGKNEMKRDWLWVTMAVLLVLATLTASGYCRQDDRSQKQKGYGIDIGYFYPITKKMRDIYPSGGWGLRGNLIWSAKGKWELGSGICFMSFSGKATREEDYYEAYISRVGNESVKLILLSAIPLNMTFTSYGRHCAEIGCSIGLCELFERPGGDLCTGLLAEVFVGIRWQLGENSRVLLDLTYCSVSGLNIVNWLAGKTPSYFESHGLGVIGCKIGRSWLF